MPEKIKLALHNVQSGIGTTKGYWQYLIHIYKRLFPHHSKNIRKLGSLIKKENVDILGTVEIDKGSYRTKNIDQVELLKKSSQLENAIFFPAFKYKNIAHQGNAIHTNYPIISSKNHRLPGAGEPRYAAEATLKINHKKLTVFITHLSLDFFYRQEQIKTLSKHINKAKGPIILAGDFNILHEGELEFLEKTDLQKVYTAKTFPVWRPSKRLDYVFASKEIQISEGRVIKKPALSDHCILIVDLFMSS
ncbi:MAG: endonuclease/exonuclease/phosphatase family protein [Minisyncoccales bacterium]